MSTKKEWGNACWYLFHTMAYKLKKEYEKEIPELLSMISLICANLPCPDCAQHATQTLRMMNRKVVNNRENLIQAMFQFHNMVNTRTGKKQFSRKEHDELYHKAQFYKIYDYFWQSMNRAVKGEKAMIYNLSRKNALIKFDKYIKDNVHIFNI